MTKDAWQYIDNAAGPITPDPGPTAREWQDYYQCTACGELQAMRPCFCVGPQNGEPLCPCRMRSVRIVDGRYVQTIDLGPAPPPKTPL